MMSSSWSTIGDGRPSGMVDHRASRRASLHHPPQRLASGLLSHRAEGKRRGLVLDLLPLRRVESADTASTLSRFFEVFSELLCGELLCSELLLYRALHRLDVHQVALAISLTRRDPVSVLERTRVAATEITTHPFLQHFQGVVLMELAPVLHGGRGGSSAGGQAAWVLAPVASLTCNTHPFRVGLDHIPTQ